MTGSQATSAGDPPTSRLRRGAVVLFFATTVLVFVVFGLASVNRHRIFHEEDSAGYLSAVAEASRLGGPAGVVGHLVSGEFLEINRMPMYPYILSAFYEPTYDFFILAKTLTYFFGIALLIIVSVVAYRRFGPASFLLAAGFLSVNEYLIYQSTFVATEALFVIFFFLAWYFLSDGFERPRSFIWGGVFLAFAYLTKGNGSFLVIAFLPALLFTYHRHIFKKLFRRKEIWLAGIAFLVICMPYFIRNARVYDSPLYNVNSDYMWLDSFGQRHWPGDHSLSAFLERNGWDGMRREFIGGAKKEFTTLQHLLKWERSTAEEHRVWYLSALIILLLFFGVGLVTDKNRGRALFSIFLVLWFLVFFSWWGRYSTSLRFMLPILPIFLIIAGKGIDWTLNFARTRWATLKRAEAYVWMIPVAFSAVLLVYLGRSVMIPEGEKNYLNLRLAGTYIVTPKFEELLAWQRENLKDGDFVLVGHDGEFQTRWLLSQNVTFKRIPLTHEPEPLQEYLDAEQPDYMILYMRTQRDVEGMTAPYYTVDKEAMTFTFHEPFPHYERIEFPGTERGFYLVMKRTEEDTEE